MPLTVAPGISIVELVHGIPVVDPFRWLEDRSLPETQEWVEKQQMRCSAYFSKCESFPWLFKRTERLLNVDTVDQPAKAAGHYFFRRRRRDEEQARIYLRNSNRDGDRLLLDGSGEGALASVNLYSLSDDASLLAYSLQHGGSDTVEIRIIETKSGEEFAARVERGYARGFAFDDRNAGYFYCQEPVIESAEHSIRWRSLRGSGEERIVFRRAGEPGSRLALLADAVHLGALWTHSLGTELRCDLLVTSRTDLLAWRPVFLNQRPPIRPILHDGRVFVFTQKGSGTGRVAELNLAGDEICTTIAEQDAPIDQLVLAGGRFFVSYASHRSTPVQSWSLDGQRADEIQIPPGASVRLLPRFGSPSESLFYTLESYSIPPIILEHEVRTGRTSPFHVQQPASEATSCSVRELSFPAKDGKKVPITILQAQDAEPRAGAVIMTSYGGFGVPSKPRYSALTTIMIELGSPVAIPHIRGGGEFGQAWHDAGRRRNRQTAVDDFLAAADWLVSQGIAAPGKMAVFGASNGGLLVGAAMTQRPELFKAVLCIAPLLDMVRYERFDQAIKWRSEYGSAADPQDFEALYALSPYHRVAEDVDYPATMFVTGDRDDRCNPAHTRKMAARLQSRAAQRASVLVDYSPERGHSPAMPLSVRVEALARRVAFLCAELDLRVPGGHES